MKRKITINISNEVYEYLKSEATKNYRSLSREIEYRFEKIIGYTPTPTTATAADSSTPTSTTTSSQADTTTTTEQPQPPKPKPKIRRIIGDEEDEIEAEQKKKEEERKKLEEEKRKEEEEERKKKAEEEKKNAPVYNDTEGTVIFEGQVYKKHPLLWLKENNIDPMDTRMDTFYRFQKVFPDVNLLEFDHYQQSRRK